MDYAAENLEGTGFARRGRAFSAAEDADIIEGRAVGLTWKDISILLGTGRSKDTVAYRHKVLIVRAEAQIAAASRAANARLRACLRCRKSFLSAWAGHRLCAACGALAADAEPYEPD